MTSNHLIVREMVECLYGAACSGSHLHVVLDDGNDPSDGTLMMCLDHAAKAKCAPCVAACTGLLALPGLERALACPDAVRMSFLKRAVAREPGRYTLEFRVAMAVSLWTEPPWGRGQPQPMSEERARELLRLWDGTRHEDDLETWPAIVAADAAFARAAEATPFLERS